MNDTEQVVGISSERQAGMARLSFWLGIVSLLTCLPAGIAGLVTGILALDHIQREPQRFEGRRSAVAGIVLSIFGMSAIPVALLISILLPSLSRARELSKRLVCGSNMKTVAMAMGTYIDQYEGDGVPPMKWLSDRGWVQHNQLICPSFGGERSNYVIVAASDPSTVTAGTVVMYEPKSNHGNEGGNIVFADGHAEFVRSPRYEELIEEAKKQLTRP